LADLVQAECAWVLLPFDYSLSLSYFFDKERGELSLVDGYLINFIRGIIPERDMLVFDIELRLMRTLRIEL